jgi:hypothetical protein
MIRTVAFSGWTDVWLVGFPLLELNARGRRSSSLLQAHYKGGDDLLELYVRKGVIACGCSGLDHVIRGLSAAGVARRRVLGMLIQLDDWVVTCLLVAATF